MSNLPLNLRLNYSLNKSSNLTDKHVSKPSLNLQVSALNLDIFVFVSKLDSTLTSTLAPSRFILTKVFSARKIAYGSQFLGKTRFINPFFHRHGRVRRWQRATFFFFFFFFFFFPFFFSRGPLLDWFRQIMLYSHWSTQTWYSEHSEHAHAQTKLCCIQGLELAVGF